MGCKAEQQRRLRSARRCLQERDCVVDIATISARADPTTQPVLDVVLEPEAAGLPPAVADVCASHGLTTRDVSRQGPYWMALLVV
jgi:hypothetical protein